MSSSSSLYLYTLISQEYSNFLIENLMDINALPLTKNPSLHNLVTRLCNVAETFHEATQTSIEVLDLDNINITFQVPYRNVLKTVLLKLTPSHAEMTLCTNKYTPVVRSFAPLIDKKHFSKEVSTVLINHFSIIFENFRKSSSSTIGNLNDYLTVTS